MLTTIMEKTTNHGGKRCLSCHPYQPCQYWQCGSKGSLITRSGGNPNMIGIGWVNRLYSITLWKQISQSHANCNLGKKVFKLSPISTMAILRTNALTSSVTSLKLKEYYEIVDEACPLSGFFPTHADFFTELHFSSWN